MPSIRRFSRHGLASCSGAGQQFLGQVLVGDRPQEPVDGQGAHGGGAGVGGGGEGAAVDHGVADFDAGGPAVDDDPADLLLQRRDQACRRRVVRFGELQGRGELAFEPVGRRR